MQRTPSSEGKVRRGNDCAESTDLDGCAQYRLDGDRDSQHPLVGCDVGEVAKMCDRDVVQIQPEHRGVRSLEKPVQ